MNFFTFRCPKALFSTSILIFLFVGFTIAQNKNGIQSVQGKLIRITPKLADIDQSQKGPVFKKTRDINGLIGIENDDDVKIHKHYPSKNDGKPDAGIPYTNGSNPVLNTLSSTINSNFAGLGFTAVAPSDNNMAAGPNHVIQMINNSSSSYFKIWNKSGTQVQAQMLLSSITGVTGWGDPVVIYDQLADRFVLTEFGVSNGVTSYANTLIMAVSVTADPTGSWKVYSFPNSGFFGDYPKFAVWQNAYYATTNDFNTSGTAYFGSTAYAFDRTAMLAGASTATVVSKRMVDNTGGRYYSMAPVCVEGTTTSTQSGLFAFLQDDSWTSNPNDVDSIFVFELTPNFTTPSASVFGTPISLATLPYNTNVPDLNQQGTSQKIQALSERLMFKVIYRNFGDHESIVCNTTVNVGSNRAGIRWWELRRPGGNWNIYQEGTFAPSTDANHRFMGSICINGNGNIGLLYNVSGTTSFPSLWFTGRSGCDPLGTMTLPETLVIAGTAANTNNRYGDYNTLTVDPTDGSFWGTGQYNTSGAWSTRMVNFALNGGGQVNFDTQPADASACAGNTATFNVAVSGAASPTYQWQQSTDGGTTFGDISGATSSTYSFTVNVSQNNYKYRCVVDAGCIVNSNSATLSVGGASINTNGQPQSLTTCAGTDATFTVSAAGSGLGYQWQQSTDGGTTFSDISGATSATLTLTSVTTTMNSNQYRVNITSSCIGVLNSSAAILTVGSAASVTSSPSSQAVCAGANVTFNISATGSNLTYQWQLSTNGGTSWSDISGQTSTSITLNAVTALLNSYQYRAVVFSCSPTGINSTPAILTVNTPVSVNTNGQPTDQTVCTPNNASFSTIASGSGIGYQWQQSTDGGITWSNITGETNATLNLSGVTPAMSNNKYRVAITGTCNSLNSNAAILVVNTPIAITTAGQPEDVAICTPNNANFSVNATGTAATYQWQASTDGGTTWSDISGAVTSTYSLTNPSSAISGNKYRVIVKGTCTPSGLTSSIATLIVNDPVAITKQPKDTIACAGSNIIFSVLTSGTGVTYQWQVSVNGGGFVNLNNGAPYSGVSTNSLTITNVAATLNGYKYRVVAANTACGAVISNSATLSSFPLPVIVLTGASNTNINPAVHGGLYTTISPVGIYTYAWYKDGSLINIISSSYLLSPDDYGTYQVIATDQNGCSSQKSNVIAITDSASGQLFVYPNPSSGTFQVRYYNAGNPIPATARTLTIFDAKGAKIYAKTYPINARYDRMDVNLINAQHGLYLIELRDINGKRIASGKVSIQ